MSFPVLSHVAFSVEEDRGSVHSYLRALFGGFSKQSLSFLSHEPGYCFCSLNAVLPIFLPPLGQRDIISTSILIIK